MNGELELDATAPVDFPRQFDQFFIGGRSDSAASWEGRLDEVALFDRVLSAEEIRKLAE